MSTRRDISDRLIHFTSGKNDEEAFQRLCKILKEKCILGTSEKIKGGYKCVCFSEAPLTSLKDGLINPDAYSRYSPFGIIFEKHWIFEQGGRPVIYQTDAEFEGLPEEYRWRHVRYEPHKDKPIDFTWEREWRIKCDALCFDPSTAGIVVPNEDWAKRMITEHEAEQDFEVFQYNEILDDEMLAEQYREPFPWRIYILK
jgi:hypothetical protein